MGWTKFSSTGMARASSRSAFVTYPSLYMALQDDVATGLVGRRSCRAVCRSRVVGYCTIASSDADSASVRSAAFFEKYWSAAAWTP